YSARTPAGRPKQLHLRFLTSPVEFLGDDSGGVRAMRVERNRLCAGDGGAIVCEGTGAIEELPVGLLFRSVGYQRVPLAGVPFDARRGLVPNAQGRVLSGPGGDPIPGGY